MLIVSTLLIVLLAMSFGYPLPAEVGLFFSIIVFLALGFFYKTKSYFRKRKLATIVSLVAYVVIGVISMLPIYNQHGGLSGISHGHAILGDITWIHYH